MLVRNILEVLQPLIPRWSWSVAVLAALLPLSAYAAVTVSIRPVDASNVWVASLPIGSQGVAASWDVPPGSFGVSRTN